MSQWGGSRPGAGRKKGGGNAPNKTSHVVKLNPRGGARAGSGKKAKYGEPTKAMRVPLSMQDSILHYIENKGFNLPVYAMAVPMGAAKLSIDHIDRTLNLNELIKHPTQTFFHPVEGDSMEPTVFAGDLAMIDAAVEPLNGDIVLASVDGGLTLKRIIKTETRIFLEADNKKYDPIILDPNLDNLICGVMIYSIRPVNRTHTKPF